VRRNCYFNNIRAGLSMSVTSSYLQDIIDNRVYHNSFFNNGHNPYDPTDHMSSGIGFGIYSGPLVITGNALKNNVLYGHRIPFGEYNINTADRRGIIALQTFAGNWDGDTRGDPRFVAANPDGNNPMDTSLPDLRLQPASPCIDSGTYLTTVLSASGSGAVLQVVDAGYFMDGWGIRGVTGDEIQLYGATQRARVTAVDYQTNTLTLDRSLTWVQNQGVCLTYEGAAPDVGAFEYGASGIARTPVAGRRQRTSGTRVVFSVQGRAIWVLRGGDRVAVLPGACPPGLYLVAGANDGTRAVKRIAVSR